MKETAMSARGGETRSCARMEIVNAVSSRQSVMGSLIDKSTLSEKQNYIGAGSRLLNDQGYLCRML